MDHTFEELKKKNVAELREVAKEIEHEAVQGYTQLNKEHLLAAICEALNIDMHVHHEVALKKERDAAIAAKKPEEIVLARKKIRKLKRALHRATV